MANERNTTGRETDPTANKLEQQSSVPNDLPDSPQDREKLQGEETRLDLPDVKDIPGQEFIHVPNLGEMADTTIASADEEGDNILGLNDDDGDASNDTPRSDSDVRRDERETLRDTTYMPTRDEDNLRQARMDNTDFDGEPLNDPSFGVGQSLTGTSLDSGDMTDDAEMGSIEETDEENKTYSLDDTDRSEPGENRTGV